MGEDIHLTWQSIYFGRKRESMARLFSKHGNFLETRIAGMANRIFVVDDEKNIADMLTMMLRKYGHEANGFYDAESALHQIDFLCPEMVICDIVMPGIDGVELAILIRRRHPECKVLLFSGSTTTVDLLEGARRRGYDFECLAKPSTQQTCWQGSNATRR